MEQGKLCLSDYKFMCVLWDNEPRQWGNLAKICLDVLGWKKSTTYTMLKKLSEKDNIFPVDCNSLPPGLSVCAVVQRKPLFSPAQTADYRAHNDGRRSGLPCSRKINTRRTAKRLCRHRNCGGATGDEIASFTAISNDNTYTHTGFEKEKTYSILLSGKTQGDRKININYTIC